jgi:D-alanyl-D-alanine carboxypeptidase
MARVSPARWRARPCFRSLAGRGLMQLKQLTAIAIVATLALGLAGQQAADANPRYAALVVDAKSGEILYEFDADEPRFPASLTKMMTLYILFEEIEAGRLSLESLLSVSAYAASIPPSKLGVAAGGALSVEDAILALAVKSANDVAVVVAENLEGSTAAFARRMTRTAQAIGMTETTFMNPHGLPDPAQTTTARDMAVLAMSLHDRFPELYEVFGTRSFRYGETVMRNTNGLLGQVEGMEGVKTGYTRASGFNLVSSVKRDGRHILAVVMGGRTSQTRNDHMRQLIEAHLPEATSEERRTPMLVADTSLVNATPLPRSRPDLPAMVADAAEPVDADAAAGIAAAPELEDDGTEMGDAALGYAPRERPVSAPLSAIDGVVSE